MHRGPLPPPAARLKRKLMLWRVRARMPKAYHRAWPPPLHGYPSRSRV